MRSTTTAWLALTSALTGALGAMALSFALTQPAAIETLDLDPVVLVGEIQSLAKLETASVTLQTTVHGTRGEGWLRAATGEELLFQGIGEAWAGIDLAELGPEDVWIDGSRVVWVRLPAAEIFRVDLDEERSSVLFRDQGWFATADKDFEGRARRAAKNQLMAQAEVLGLEQAAAERAQLVIGDLIEALGAEQVRFTDVPNPLQVHATGT